MNEYKCVRGHDRCHDGAESGPDCPYCERATVSLNRLAAEVHAANQHWWHDPATGEPLDRNVGEMFMLMTSEVAEAMEGERKNLMDDKLPHRPMAEVELGDIKIRVLDYAGAKKLDLIDYETPGLDPMPENKADALWQITRELVKAYDAIESGRHWHARRVSLVLAYIDRYARVHGYDLDGAVAEKRAYNATRADHKPEARLAAGGKRW